MNLIKEIIIADEGSTDNNSAGLTTLLTLTSFTQIPPWNK